MAISDSKHNRFRQALPFPAAIILACWCVGLPRLHAEYETAVEIGNLNLAAIHESSGIATSQMRGQTLWTHNDSGDSPRLFAIDHVGKHLGTCNIANAKAIDWEDIASFRLGNKPYLLIGDVGDNRMVRPDCQLYLVPEVAPTEGSAEVEQVVTYTYENGAIDCESVGFDPTSGAVLLVEKTWKPTCRVYSFQWPAASDSQSQVARKIGTVNLAGVTGMDVSPDGRRAVLVTYGHAYVFSRQPNQSWTDAFQQTGDEVLLPTRKQGESICFGEDGITLFLTSEKRPTPLYQVPFKN